MAPRAPHLYRDCTSSLQGSGLQRVNAEPGPRPPRATATRRLQPRLQHDNLPLRNQTPPQRKDPPLHCQRFRCTAQFSYGEAGFLVLQPSPPSPPSPRVQNPLTCLPKGSEEMVPPPVSRTPQAHVGAGRLFRKQAPPPPPPMCRPRPLGHFACRLALSSRGLAHARQA